VRPLNRVLGRRIPVWSELAFCSPNPAAGRYDSGPHKVAEA